MTLDKSLVISASRACLRNADRTKPGSLNQEHMNGFSPGTPYKSYEGIHVYGYCVHRSLISMGFSKGPESRKSLRMNGLQTTSSSGILRHMSDSLMKEFPDHGR